MKKLIILILILVPAGIFAQESSNVNTLKNDNFNQYYTASEIAYAEEDKQLISSSDVGLNESDYDLKPFLDRDMGEVKEEDLFSKKKNLILDSDSYIGDGMVTFSKDGKTVFFSANRKIKKSKGQSEDEVKIKRAVNLQLFKASVNEDGAWTNLEILPFSSSHYSTGQPFLNEDDTKLYFVSDGPESLGRTDIFVVDLLEDGTYGKPKNMGPKINSREREIFPFINEENLLLFSSDVQNESGDLDVFASKIFDHSVSTPIKLKGNLKIQKDDLVANIDDAKAGEDFSSPKKSGVGVAGFYASIDASSIEIDCQQEISGIVKDSDNKELLPNVQIMLFDNNDNKLLSFQSDESDASFSFKQSCDETYKLKAYLEGYLTGELDIKTVNDINSDPMEITIHMSADPDNTNDVIAEVPEINETVGLNLETSKVETAPVSPSNNSSGNGSSYNFNSDLQVFTVQIGAFQGNAQTAKYITLSGFFNHVYNDGYNRYFSGIFESYKEAEKHKELLKNNGYNDAFIVGLKGEDRF